MDKDFNKFEIKYDGVPCYIYTIDNTPDAEIIRCDNEESIAYIVFIED